MAQKIVQGGPDKGKIIQSSKSAIIKPPKRVIKEDVATDKDIVGMQSPLRKIQYEISKAKGKQVR